MRAINVTFVAVLFLFPVVAFPDDDEQALRQIKTVLWPQAYRTQDVELLDRLLHDSFEMIDADGNRSTKKQELESVAASPWNPGEFEFRIERLQIYEGMFAVVDGTGIADAYTYKSSNFLIKQDGQWRAIASHVSGVKEKEPG
jgi:Domain of unknown function (DUF4440)